MQVRTSKLNFVTYDPENPLNGDASKGVHALKITYTLDANVADNFVGEAIEIDHTNS
jgi:hypothetical protein